MPVFIINQDERLTYTPDRDSFANFPPMLREAIAAWAVQAETQQQAFYAFLTSLGLPQPVELPDGLATPLRIPPALVDALDLLGTFDTQDVTYTYKRLAGNVRAAIIHQHTTLGITDVFSTRWAMGEAALLGWHNVLDVDGHQVPFDKSLIPGLPGDHVFQIGILVDAGAPTDFLSRWLASSNGTHSSKETTAPDAERVS